MNKATERVLINLIRQAGINPAPVSMKAVEVFLEELFMALFQSSAANAADLKKTSRLLSKSEQNLIKILKSFCKDEKKVAATVIAKLPEIFSLLIMDAVAILNGDPAAKNLQEVICSYPGFFAIYAHRLAHELYLQNQLLPARLLSEYSHKKTGIDIHPGASIGESFCIDHGTGIVIGETAIIGKNVKLYQGVTLGGISVDKKLAGKKRHPTIEDGVVIYASATILGGKTTIGKNSIIGANVWLTSSVPANSKVFHQPKITIKTKKIL